MRRVFKTRYFAKWMKQTELTNEALCQAVMEMQQGLIDAHLGGNVVKKRIALPNRGKSRSTRTLIATNYRGLWFFLMGFAKNERVNISFQELKNLQKIATDWLALDIRELQTAIKQGNLEEICDETSNIKK
jgi:hypothetical protein